MIGGGTNSGVSVEVIMLVGGSNGGNDGNSGRSDSGDNDGLKVVTMVENTTVITLVVVMLSVC
jgi:hypothetical protein